MLLVKFMYIYRRRLLLTLTVAPIYAECPEFLRGPQNSFNGINGWDTNVPIFCNSQVLLNIRDSLAYVEWSLIRNTLIKKIIYVYYLKMVSEISL